MATFNSKIIKITEDVVEGIVRGVKIFVRAEEDGSPLKFHKKDYQLNSEEVAEYVLNQSSIKPIIERICADATIALIDKLSKQTNEKTENLIQPNKDIVEDLIAEKRPELEDVIKKPGISSLVITESYQTIVIEFYTDEISDTTVEYGLNETYGTILNNPDLVLKHVFYIENLPLETYHLRVKTKDVSGDESVSTNQVITLTIKDPPLQ